LTSDVIFACKDASTGAAVWDTIDPTKTFIMDDVTYIATDEVRARDADGLILGDGTANHGIFVEYGGLVGIGNTNPNNMLHITENADSKAAFNARNEHATGQGFIISAGDTDVAYCAVFRKYDNTTDLMKISGTGQIKIGTGNPTEALDVTGTIKLDNLIDQNSSYVATVAIQTADATPVDLLSLAVAEGEAWNVSAQIVGRLVSDGSDRAVYNLQGCFYRNSAGNVTQEGATITHEIESDATWDADLVVDVGNQTVDVKITGPAAPVDWRGRITYVKQ